MGLMVGVYRQRGQDCTLDGISSRFEHLCLVNVAGPFVPTANCAPAFLDEGNVRGAVRIIPGVEVAPGVYQPTEEWVMFGGNYAATSDSRFTRAVEKITGAPFYGAVPIHDRIEG